MRKSLSTLVRRDGSRRLLLAAALTVLVVTVLGAPAFAAKGGKSGDPGQGAPAIEVTISCPATAGASEAISIDATVENVGRGNVFLTDVTLNGGDSQGGGDKLKSGESESFSFGATGPGTYTVEAVASRGTGQGQAPAATSSDTCVVAPLAGAGPTGLARTGFDPAPFAAAASALLLSGGGLGLFVRRRS
jgi:hypothetical protein